MSAHPQQPAAKGPDDASATAGREHPAEPAGKDEIGSAPVAAETVSVPLAAAPETHSANASEEAGKFEKHQAPIVALDEKFPIQLFDEESFGKKLSYWGPFVTGVASIVLTLFVWSSTKRISEQQIALQNRQTELQEEQVRAELADMRSKFFNDLTSTDETRKTFAAISLAGHGVKAWPVVHLALGVEQGEIRSSAVTVVHRLFQSETNSEGRQRILDQLKGEFESPNISLHLGVVESLVEIEPLMNAAECEQMRVFLQAKIPSRSACTNPAGRQIVQEAAKFLDASNSSSLPYFLSIVESPECGNGWLQVMLNLETVAPDLPATQRAELREKVERIRTDVLNDLRKHIRDADLAGTTGFGGFVTKNGISINFAKFKQAVEQEFTRLEKALSDK